MCVLAAFFFFPFAAYTLSHDTRRERHAAPYKDNGGGSSVLGYIIDVETYDNGDRYRKCARRRHYRKFYRYVCTCRQHDQRGEDMCMLNGRDGSAISQKKKKKNANTRGADRNDDGNHARGVEKVALQETRRSRPRKIPGKSVVRN